MWLIGYPYNDIGPIRSPVALSETGAVAVLLAYHHKCKTILEIREAVEKIIEREREREKMMEN